MKPHNNIEKLIAELVLPGTKAGDERILNDALAAYEKTETEKTAERQPGVWRIIMQSKMTKFATAAVIIIAVFIGLNVFEGAPVWAIGQTFEALGNVENMVIAGNDYWGSEAVPFTFTLKLPEDKKDELQLRFESEKQIIVIKGTKAWAYLAHTNTVKIYDDVTESYGMMQDLAFWYKITEHNPWVSGKILSILKLYADNWQETYGKCENTGQDCVVVTCDYKNPSVSFWFVCDLETKLIVEGKYWRNNDRQGQPVCHADSFKYNVDLDDETFNFKIPEGAKVIYRKNLKREKDLKEKAWELFENKQYAESLEIYLKVDDLCMAGICYDNMGKHIKAIESYEELLLKKGFDAGSSPAYFYLGASYMQIDNNEKAIEAFKNCLRFGQGVRDPEAFPMKNARQGIEKLKN